MAVFVTGATGFLGSHLVSGLLVAGEALVLLARGRDVQSAERKVRDALRGLGADPERLAPLITVCRGSLEEPGLGLSPADRDFVLATCDQFLHCGASVRLDLPLEQARAVNVRGTRAMLQLATERQRRASVSRFDYVSSAYVAGNRTDVVGEHELDGRLGHKNTYERSKFEAEALVRQACEELPVTIYRPSLVVGNSATGETSSFKTLYWPAKVYALGLWRTCPGRPQTPIDLVPVNCVRDAFLEIRRRPASLGRCCHVTAGPQGTLTVGELAAVFHEVFAGSKPVRFVDPAWFMRLAHPVLRCVSWGGVRDVVRALEFYVPYFSRNPQFDNSNTVELLAGSAVTLPHGRDYIRRLLHYGIETDWGQRPR